MTLTSYPGTVRQLIVTGLGRDAPTVIITNDTGIKAKALIPDEVDLGVERPGQFLAGGPGHNLPCDLVAMPARFSVGGISLQNLLPLPQHALHGLVMCQPRLDVATHDDLSRVIKQDERQAGIADALPDEESANLV